MIVNSRRSAFTGLVLLSSHSSRYIIIRVWFKKNYPLHLLLYFFTFSSIYRVHKIFIITISTNRKFLPNWRHSYSHLHSVSVKVHIKKYLIISKPVHLNVLIHWERNTELDRKKKEKRKKKQRMSRFVKTNKNNYRITRRDRDILTFYRTKECTFYTSLLRLHDKIKSLIETANVLFV